MHRLFDALGGGVARRHFNTDRVVEHGGGQLPDRWRESGRKQQALALLGQQIKNAADIGNKAHVEHAICFVQHQNLDLGQVNGTLTMQIKQTAGGGHDNIHPLA